MNSAPFDHPAWAALSFVPILFFLAWLFFVLGAAIFMIVMILRFVKAHERLAKHLEVIARQRTLDTKDQA